MSKTVQVSEHKAFGIAISESPHFSCHLIQYFVENMDDFKNSIVHADDSNLMIGLNYAEFMIAAEEIIRYYQEMKESNILAKELFTKAE